MADLRSDWPRGLPSVDEPPVFVVPDPSTLLVSARRTRRMQAVVAGAVASAVVAVSAVVGLDTASHRADKVSVVTPPDEHATAPDKKPVTPHSDRGTTRQDPAGTSDPHEGMAVATDDTTTSDTATSEQTTPAHKWRPELALATATDFRRTTVSNPPATSCAYQPMSAPSGWCLDYIGPDSARAGEPVSLAVDICRIQGIGAGTLHFANGQEADISVYAYKADGWRWSHGRQFATTPHELRVAAGTCLRWTTRWTTRGDSGRWLPRGDYSLSVNVLSPDINLPNSATGTAGSFELT